MAQGEFTKQKADTSTEALDEMDEEKTIMEYCIEQAKEDCPDAHPEDYINSLTNVNLIAFLNRASAHKYKAEANEPYARRMMD
jgi:hypothetical protein